MALTTRYNSLKPENFTPINIEEVKEEWMRINNVPNDMWFEIQESLEIINDEDGIYPYTFKTFKLNNLPYSVVVIMMYQLNVVY